MAHDLVGRESELAALDALLAGARDQPAGVLIEGEAGIGKTSVWEEGVRRAEARAYRVLRCRPAEAETELAYAALGDLLAPVADAELDDLVELQREALEVALLRVRTERAADPRAIFTGLVAVLTRLAEQAPLLVAIDDVQWLDAASARALEFAFRRLPASIMLILARRTAPKTRQMAVGLRDGDEVRAVTAAPPASSVSEAEPAGESLVFGKEGDYWTIGRPDALFRLRDTKGLHHLDELLRHPHREFHAVELAAGGHAGQIAPAAPAAGGREAAEAGLHPELARDAGEILDPDAKAAYRRRLEELEEDLAEAEQHHDPERAARAREEIDFLSRELAAAVGLGGRDRRAASTAERARVNVTRSIRLAIKKIAENDERLGRYLDASVKTGIFCSYEPLEKVLAPTAPPTPAAVPEVPTTSSPRAQTSAFMPPPLEQSLPAERLERLVLRPLSLAELDKVLKRKLGGSFSRPALVRLRELSDGNPFFAIEIGRELLRRGGEPAVGDRLPVPETLQELLAARIEAISPAARDILLMASALSRPSVDVLEDALDRRPTVGPALIEAEEAGLVTVEGGRVRFTHPLLASTVYASAAGERRRRLHGRLAEVAAEEEERARHLALSVTAPDEDAATVLERAAQGANRRGAQDAVAELFEWSRRLTPADREQDLARRTLGEAAALFVTGDIGRARELTQAAVETAAPGPLRAEALLLLGRISHVDQMSGVASEHLDRTLAEAGDDRRLRGRIHAELAWTNIDDHARAVEHAEAAIRLLDAEDEPALMAFALFTKFFSDVQLGRGADRELLRRGLELEQKAASRLTAFTDFPLIWFKFMDEFDEARSRYRAQAEWAKDRGHEGPGRERLSQLAELELRSGNWELAERYIEESCSDVEQAGLGGPLFLPLRIRAMIDAHLGRVERARATLTAIIEEAERRGSRFWAAYFLSIRGFVELTAGDAAAADEALTRMTEHLEEVGVVDALGQRSEPDHIEALVALGELDRARVVLARLEERGERLPRLWISTTLPRCRALVLASAGDVPAALAAVDEGVEHADAGMLPFELARTLLVKGHLHRRAEQYPAAKDALTQALEIFERLGAPTWAERVRAELSRVGLRPPARPELGARR